MRTSQAEPWTASRDAWDVVFDVSGRQPVSACVGTLRAGGVYISCAGSNGGPWFGPLPRLAAVALRGLVDRRVTVHAASVNTEDLDTLLRMVSSGALRPWLSEEVTLEGAPSAVERQFRQGGGGGKVIVRVGEAPR